MAEEKNMSFYMENKSIEQLYYWVLSEDVEICGRLLMNKDNMYVIDDSVIGKGDTEIYTDLNGIQHSRKKCDYPSPRGDIFFHTHPMSSKSYPSYEDIISLAKLSYNKIYKSISIIGTKWGIWYIRKRKSHIPMEEYEKYKKKYIEQTKLLYENMMHDIDHKIIEYINK
jgi:hypothetical protein